MDSNIIYLPRQEDTVTVSRSELQELIAQAVQGALGSQVKKKHHMTKEEREEAASPYKKDGSKKATAAYPLKDTEDIRRVREYLLFSDQVREYAIFSAGLTLGVRANDLLSLKVKDVFDSSGEYKDRIDIIEMKTDKRNKPSLTKYAKEAIDLYLETRKKIKSPEEYLFRTNNIKGSPCSLSYFNTKLREAGEALGLRLSSHTMRHTFSYLMSTQTAGVVEGNISYMSLFVTQMAMNHSNISQTLSYTGLTQDLIDERREIVSQYLLERT